MNRPTSPVAAEVRRLLLEAEVSQYRMREAGIAPESARILLGLREGVASPDVIDVALGLLTPPRQLWHRRKK